ncbi:lactoylglutathione lyase [Paramagnetospirillum marisnigri]|uniref:Lactoylglutathione lyase n=1 Tax=Paramagnetospirillum marisnigri TaxID=1285242 RepID=A0A178MA47_9PROT|nr:VOC family protein [Paramagnetospirillum marisnigri]OAN45640.1 lactoylglutathione lyase [Paramagnetospirillum marisnigri]
MPGLDHVNVVVSDMARSLDFYTTLLDLTVVMDRRLSGDWFEQVTGQPGAVARCVILDAPGGGCRIELLQFQPGGARPDHRQPPTAMGLRHLALRVDDLDHRLKLLAQRFNQEVSPVQVPQDIVKSGKRMCYIRDPDGILVELCEYGAHRPEFC